jgi:ABC-type branched-subunit amino acid transport system ATPase component
MDVTMMADRSNGPTVDIRDLTRRFGELVAVDRVSFTVEHGETLG